MPPSRKRPAAGPAPIPKRIEEKGRGFTTSKHGMKKQKLSAQSAELRANTKKARDIAALVRAKEQKLSAKKAVAKEGAARIPYNRHMHYLLIGEGNFSFTHALVQHFLQQAEKDSSKPAPAAAAATAVADDADDEEKAGRDVAAAGKSKWNRKREGAFDVQRDVPLLPPHSLFHNRNVRVVSTCYDSWKELLFKYPDVTTHLSYLAAQHIPIYTGVDCLRLDSTRRAGRLVTAQAIQAASQAEREGKVANEAARAARRQQLEANDEAGVDDAAAAEAEEEEQEEDDEESNDAAADPNQDPATAALLAPKRSPLLFPPFITRRTFHLAQSLAEKKLHGSQRKKLKEKKAAELDEFREKNEAQKADAAAAAGNAAAAAAVRPTNSGALKVLHRAAVTDASLSQLNAAPRTRFHRILFHFPHTGCGLKDTEANNEVHRTFLRSFLEHIVATRILLPANRHGELHITLKRGEPYSSWNLVGLAARTPGLNFKTSFPFHPHLYAGYAHRRTRGFDETREVDLSTGAPLLRPNSDIASGGMTYVFTREETRDDEEEAKFEARWAAEFAVASEEESVRQGLRAECDRIFKETTDRQAAAQAQPTQQVRQRPVGAGANAATAAMAADDAEDVSMEHENDEDPADGEAAAEEDAEEEQREDDAAEPAAEESAVEGEEEADAPVPNLAAALRMHFQPRSVVAAGPTKLQQQLLHKKYGKPAGGNAGKRKK